MRPERRKPLPLILLSVLFLLLAAGVYLLLFGWRQTGQADGPAFDGGAPAQSVQPQELAAQSAEIEYDPESGELYLNNEITVITAETADPAAVARLAESVGASADQSMADIGFYTFRFSQAMTREELDSVVRKLRKDDLTEEVYLSTLSALDFDAADDPRGSDDPVETPEPIYPNDPWNGAGWSMEVPRGENWGVEAIRAPGAWPYLRWISDVNIGLIDLMPDTGHEDLEFSDASTVLICADGSEHRVTVSAEDHGTHVAAIMDAEWNKKGVTGVMGGAAALYYGQVVRELDDGSCDYLVTPADYVRAIRLLLDRNVQAINISLNTGRLTAFAASRGNSNAIASLTSKANVAGTALKRVIEQREARGLPDFVICVAAGNVNTLRYVRDDKSPFGYREATGWDPGWSIESGDVDAKYNNYLNLIDEPSVRERIIVVGAAGINYSASSAAETRYSYASFSNIGARVDIAAPGVGIYSAVAGNDRYGILSGTSMATPHVTGAAGMVFALNPSLTGPQVKSLLKAMAGVRFTYTGGYCAMLDLQKAAELAMATRSKPVGRVINEQESFGGLDLCFLVDTTSSMSDDIDNVRQNMGEILSALAAKTENYRVGLIDYRDFSSRTGDSRDYPSRIQLDFTSDNDSIVAAINALSLGYGGDEKETVYSALMAAAQMPWRPDAKKVIIILGDAPPLDPEPNTGFTYDSTLLAIFNADIGIDLEHSDPRVLENPENSLISVYTIGTGNTSSADEFFESISRATDGSFYDIDDAAKVSDAVIDSIEEIPTLELVTVNAGFGEAMAGREIDLYEDDDYLFSIRLDETGRGRIEDVPEGEYRWECRAISRSGSLQVSRERRTAELEKFSVGRLETIRQRWNAERLKLTLCGLLIAAVAILVPLIVLLVARPKHPQEGRRRR